MKKEYGLNQKEVWLLRDLVSRYFEEKKQSDVSSMKWKEVALLGDKLEGLRWLLKPQEKYASVVVKKYFKSVSH